MGGGQLLPIRYIRHGCKGGDNRFCDLLLLFPIIVSTMRSV